MIPSEPKGASMSWSYTEKFNLRQKIKLSTMFISNKSRYIHFFPYIDLQISYLYTLPYIINRIEISTIYGYKCVYLSPIISPCSIITAHQIHRNKKHTHIAIKAQRKIAFAIAKHKTYRK